MGTILKKPRKIISTTLVFSFVLGFNSFSQSQKETMIQVLTNDLRSRYDLMSLKFDPKIQRAAESHSKWMAKKRLLTHHGPVPGKGADYRIRGEGFTGYLTGENIACGNEDPIETFMQWVNSDSHLRGLLNPNFNLIGISKVSVSDGVRLKRCSVYWTQDFGSTLSPEQRKFETYPDLTEAKKIGLEIAKKYNKNFGESNAK